MSKHPYRCCRSRCKRVPAAYYHDVGGWLCELHRDRHLAGRFGLAAVDHSLGAHERPRSSRSKPDRGKRDAPATLFD